MAYRDGWQVCAPWVDPDQLCCEGVQTAADCDGVEQPLTFQWTDEDYALAASNLLFNRTGRRWPGACEQTVWPCLDCNCSDHPCGCGRYAAIKLPGNFPILGVSEVTIDGVVVDPAEYRLDQNRNLVKIDGTCWPRCNTVGILSDNGSSCVDLLVTYTAGRVPPVDLAIAAGELACELKRACNDSDQCGITGVRDHVQSIARRGVSMQLHDITDLLATGSTGNAIIDHALKAYGVDKPFGLLLDPLALARAVDGG